MNVKRLSFFKKKFCKESAASKVAAFSVVLEATYESETFEESEGEALFVVFTTFYDFLKFTFFSHVLLVGFVLNTF